MSAGMERHPDRCGTCGGLGTVGARITVGPPTGPVKVSDTCRDCRGTGVNHEPAGHVFGLDGRRLCHVCGSMPVATNHDLAVCLRGTLNNLIASKKEGAVSGLYLELVASNIEAVAEALEGRCYPCHLKGRGQ